MLITFAAAYLINCLKVIRSALRHVLGATSIWKSCVTCPVEHAGALLLQVVQGIVVEAATQVTSEIGAFQTTGMEIPATIREIAWNAFGATARLIHSPTVH